MTAVRAFSVPFRGYRLAGAITSAADGDTLRVLALHGGGQSNHRTAQYLLTHLAEHGLPGAAFDHIGHGDTGGELSDSSLDDRVEQAVAVAQARRMRPPLALIGSSMGGHIACRLITRLQPEALVLFCPAAYEAAAEPLPFGPAFQQTIRSTSDFAASPAFEALEHFRGRLLLVLGEQDAVIPPAVIEQYRQRARQAARVELISLPAGHLLHRWLQEQPDRMRPVLDRVRAILQA
ncbi:alpha/beta fold hydrolase [Xylophilus rhododendri]|uniref:Alpha/beta fold hydrolase n=1 Tax=Xylophilus rhododendri TaxID=2697032 RepID=A0A857JAQ8_9BURK|nr:alpha/beta fold hydrolase [Xylophilus rhododendri]QHJ01101.1 alpha/beta fold hydrolase [Xylophilus rhododendri]